MTEEVPKTTVSAEETRLAFAVPAPLVNKFYVHMGSGFMRLAFSELYPDVGLPIFRSAVVLHFQDAIALRNLLATMLDPIEKQIADAMAQRESEHG